MSKTTLILLSGALTLITSCGGGPNAASSPQYVAYDFSLQDAVDVYQCAYDKETEPTQKTELQKGLYLHLLLKGDEARFKAEADPTRAVRQKNLNEIAVKYQCPPGK